MMTKARLLRTLADLSAQTDGEIAHSKADDALLDFIGDPEITAAYRAAHPGWCA